MRRGDMRNTPCTEDDERPRPVPHKTRRTLRMQTYTTDWPETSRTQHVRPQAHELPPERLARGRLHHDLLAVGFCLWSGV